MSKPSTHILLNRFSLLGIIILLWIPPAIAEPVKVIVPPLEKTVEGHVVYFLKALQLALKKTEASDGAFEIAFAPELISVERSVADLKNRKTINVMWTTTNKKREQDLLPVRISLVRELNNYRIFLIRKGDQAKFDQVKSLEDLGKLNAGLGSQWPDTEVMRNNDLNVVTSPGYSTLFKMLTAKRFDYFPRGLYEIWNEAEAHKDEGIVIEKNIMLYYEAPFYFFLNKKDTALADRIERGLNLAIADGSFDELLQSAPGFKRGMEEQTNGQRKLFVLSTPYNLRN